MDIFKKDVPRPDMRDIAGESNRFKQYIDPNYRDPDVNLPYSGLTKDILDFIADEYQPSEILWFDVYSRMPFSRIGELMYDSYDTYIKALVNGDRSNIKIKNAQKSIFRGH